MADDFDDEGNKRLRSPPYPSIPLSKAVERAGALYAKALHHQVGLPVLAEAWKYGLKSSGLNATAGALNQFGLLSGQGSGTKRRYTLTEAAIRIIKDADPSSTKRAAALKAAALAPGVYAELWTTFNSASDVSEVVLRNFLTLDRMEGGRAPYSDQAAKDIIENYKASLAYAGLSDPDALPASAGDIDDVHEEEEARVEHSQVVRRTGPEGEPSYHLREQRDEVKPLSHERELVTGLLSKDASFRVIVSGPIGVKEIERLIRKLEFDKEILADVDGEEDYGGL